MKIRFTESDEKLKYSKLIQKYNSKIILEQRKSPPKTTTNHSSKPAFSFAMVDKPTDTLQDAYHPSGHHSSAHHAFNQTQQVGGLKQFLTSKSAATSALRQPPASTKNASKRRFMVYKSTKQLTVPQDVMLGKHRKIL